MNAVGRNEVVTEIFLAACDLAPEQRAEYLGRACEDDLELRAEVESLLRYDDPESLLKSGAAEALKANFDVPARGARESPPVRIPDQIGRYRIDRELGTGGFGVVFLGYDQQLERRVAIKVPHARLVTREIDAAAYLAEARAVATLDHPNIVPV
jgi:serine/threonine protein kinase